jgi:hypothetical protein
MTDFGRRVCQPSDGVARADGASAAARSELGYSLEIVPTVSVMPP